MDISKVQFHMFQTTSLHSAIYSYREKTGFDPTLCLARPELEVEGNSPILVISRFGAAGCLLLTHLASTDDWAVSHNEFYVPSLAKPKTSIKKVTGRAERTPEHCEDTHKAKCPHCQQNLRDFNELGWWYGWQEGKDPPYWSELRLHVFRRDNYTCRRCRRRYGTNDLRAHHITPKELGGSDSAKNLITLCSSCHEDEHPIFQDE